ncbi:hypothetical protein Hypma_012610 [Hypsizygus marmoreus]|uniref:Uncharacterized protein n=1 Tax=Hypsizygus marmoreus TaxID=39966 RepID=A0A369JEJ6_HYPMA|nr:hypothetical protein Hypma_012610 [Hypsizygus marmoreus]
MKMMLPRHPRAIDAGDRSMSPYTTLSTFAHHDRLIYGSQHCAGGKTTVLTTHDDRSSVPPPSHLLQHFEMMPETLTSCCEQHSRCRARCICTTPHRLDNAARSHVHKPCVSRHQQPARKRQRTYLPPREKKHDAIPESPSISATSGEEGTGAAERGYLRHS